MFNNHVRKLVELVFEIFYENIIIFSWPGNKRNEAEDFLKHADFEGIENIIEPFCGTAAISYHIWLKYGDKFNYYLNDNDTILFKLYELMKKETVEEIESKINDIMKKVETKEDWKEALKNKDVYHYIFFNKYSAMARYGFCSLNWHNKRVFKITKVTENFINFIKQPYVNISNNNWFDLFDNYKDDKTALFIFDPPYINVENSFYIDPTLNIYQYFHDNPIENYKSHIYLVLESNWIIKLLFIKNKILLEYNKKYELTKKQTSHLIIYNKN